ncbi:SDR family NAD(P)-dependent oxidoreductase [Sporichthya polymorpha]|uniref:SDR family NAD(P)-dependent oxidoreductase n=1 Tax=Sporichthya polymorpha TaxID=35751 RepID=UPI000375962C|nr:SDR family oxidoreductase [Sporichthya polymorpha]
MGQLDGKVALVTGGSRGIGRTIAQAYLDEGARVVISSRSEANGKEALHSFDAGDRATFLAGDMTVRESVDQVVDGTVAHFGALDILVNNAGGIQTLGTVWDLSDDGWMDTINLNLHATFWATRRALPHMMAKGWGRVLNISSLEGKVGLPMISAYCAAKHAIHGFTKAVAKEVGRAGVTVNCLCPGYIPETDLARNIGADIAPMLGLGSVDDLSAMFAQQSATGRTPTLADCVGPAVLLASDAGASITGVTLSIDGGIAQS